MSATRKARLGKGLEALLGEYLPEQDGASGTGVRTVPVAGIAPNPFQPRREFAPESLAELESSIRENGLLQPLVVRPAAETGRWELVAGERRWRAVRRLGWAEVPAVVKRVDDRAMLILAIVENVQRAGLSPLEEATGYRQLVEEFGFTQAEVAESVGRERSTVANLLRLLLLPASVQRMLQEDQLSMGHARALLGLPNERQMTDVAREVVARGLSVRATEDRVRQGGRAKPPAAARSAAPADPHVRQLQTELQRRMGTEVRIRVEGKRRGRIEIPFFGDEDFERVLELLLGPDAVRR